MSILVAYLMTPGYEQEAQSFFESLCYFGSGMAYDFLVVQRGFMDSPFRFEPPGANQMSYVSQPNNAGWDIDALLRVADAEARDYDWLVWFCSSSRILSDRWLSKLYGMARSPKVGAVAATGSLEAGITRRLPNPHLRPSCLMMSPKVLRDAGFGVIDNYRGRQEFEHGLESLYARLVRVGLSGLVVGADGRGYGVDRWEESNTFRKGIQANLLVADRQTDGYMQASQIERSELAVMAGWSEAL